MLGPGFKLTQARGSAIESDLAPVVTATAQTAHPSAILRTRDDDARHAAREALRSDLAMVAAALRDAA